MRNGLSAVLIVKNEEKVLERCLKSLELVDEIVILDTGSTDGTLQLAKSITRKVYSAPPMDPFHFADARNLALKYAKEDWVITIDADEIAHDGFVEAVRKGVWNHSKASAFTVKFLVSSEDGSNPASLPKLKVFRRAHWEWKYRIHEILVPLRSPTPVYDLPEAVMEHLPPSDKSVRRQQNMDLLEISVKESPEYIRNARQLGMELFSRDQFKDALPWLQMYLDSGTGGPLDRSETLIHMARCHSSVGALEESFQLYDKAIAEAPVRREAYYYKAIALIKAARPDLAIPVLEACLQIPSALKPDFYLNIENIWQGTYPEEALKFCKDTMEEHHRTKGV